MTDEKPWEIGERAFEFAVRVVRVCQTLDKSPGVSRTLANQLLRSGTSIGANLEESKGGQSRADYHLAGLHLSGIAPAIPPKNQGDLSGIGDTVMISSQLIKLQKLVFLTCKLKDAVAECKQHIRRASDSLRTDTRIRRIFLALVSRKWRWVDEIR